MSDLSVSAYSYSFLTLNIYLTELHTTCLLSATILFREWNAPDFIRGLNSCCRRCRAVNPDGKNALSQVELAAQKR